jgi:chromosome segregation ATPase
MDADLKALLETMREANAAAQAEARQRFDVLAEGLRIVTDTVTTNNGRLDVVAEGLRTVTDTVTTNNGRLEVIAEGLQTLAVNLTTNNRRLDRLERENAAAHAETHHQFKIISEGLRHEVQIVAEGVAMNGEKLDRLEGKVDRVASEHDARLTRLEAAGSRLLR